MANSNTKIEMLSASQVRSYIESQRGESESFTACIDRMVVELGISRRAIYNAQKNGVFAEVRRAGAVLHQLAAEQSKRGS